MRNNLSDMDWEADPLDDDKVVPPDPYPLESLDDPVKLTLGFRCPQTDDEWHLHVRSVKGHILQSLFSTHEGRQEIARRLVEEAGYPWAFPEYRQAGSATQG